MLGPADLCIRHALGGALIVVALLTPTPREAWAQGGHESPVPGSFREVGSAGDGIVAQTNAKPDRDPGPGWDYLEAEGAVIGRIEIRVGDIFDPEVPGEDRFLFRLANRLHRNTRDAVIRRQLLFEEGDLYEARVLEETERVLRENRYLRDAEIEPVRFEQGRVDLEVFVKDVWTLNGGFGLGRGGGVTSTRFQLQDYNILGTGKGLTLRQASDVDRTSTEVIYDDRNLAGSRWQLDGGLSDNSDGSRYSLEVGRPFFSLDSRWAFGLRILDDDRVDSLYDLGEITEQFRHQTEWFEIGVGRSRGLVGDRTRRWSGGLTVRRDNFDAVPEPRLIPDPADGPPEDRSFAYPWIAFESIRDDFLTARNQDRMDRVEDFDLGRRAHVRMGLSTSTLGASREAALFSAGLGQGWRFSGARTLLLAADLSGRWSRNGAEEAILEFESSFYRRNFEKHLFFVSLDGRAARNLDPESQILLGGDNGLRGYPLRYQAGERSLLLTLEQRFFTDLNPWKLFRVGAAVFFDAGGVWGQGGSGRESDFGLLKDVGVGLRVGSTRSGRGSVVHLDVAFPLDGDGSIRSVQWLVESKETF